MTIKRTVSLFLVLAALAAVLIGVHFFSKSRTTQLFGGIIARVETERPVVALTFDDGPSVRFTPDVLTILRERGVKATFFLTGKETEENLPQARMIVSEGHQLGNHSYTHSNMMFMGPARIREEIERTDAAIRAAGYEGEIMFRPPYGKKLLTLPWYLSRHDRKTIMWDVEPESFPDVADDAAALASHVIEQTRNGSIIIMHVMYRSREVSRQALPLIIDGLRQRGFEFVTVAQLL
ncbi:peptidoglycan/xylan/chitin deacetylase (PgdA/CDA1 family) [Agrobacterium tumefaciens]|jgi:peptidoglycan/xylan/chitin deacetylase (PgdA/CDA1 family)|uniref:Chitooligosaccharide deacetylase n=1 Tax=Agrobacterium tumefaciens TaxID=358 RepID=A0AAP9E570_AGRTU|nr:MULTISPECIES: polysaccharide deacetylase family protein [Agrobacterium tumefaciens complex]MBB4406672.1 peptidoglycan/xylan/chitin deacetylase (PgdA/CDA1 family) [Agrobacterium radiobacter]MBB4449919.1 peptidoglycan/xylan/chitin deacetylase (PgdA/CDA1 family) [Agrobacterium radiobacter]MBP2508606.1 peptidoglycan/xylan/chitin deacetylase (PgdA/CDA1 family) [Agrobacterium tumefaciens]MBP2517758.1 peptidoglycan/xylan/chitin deacetylase (PgdA/CDA1 family) [Agrobacterium tumefaciens]MBP2567235.1